VDVAAGGVDEIVDWSKTAPKRKQKRPADSAGDFDDKVSGSTTRKLPWLVTL
jgi:hypothetical protein